MEDNLTKKDFWDALLSRYSEVYLFYDWIEKYKERIGWNDLFNAVTKDEREYFDWNNEAVEIKAPEFHDLPMAMQWGIFQQFCAEQFPSGFGGIESAFEHPKDMQKIPELITEYFAEMKSNNDTERMSAKYT